MLPIEVYRILLKTNPVRRLSLTSLFLQPAVIQRRLLVKAGIPELLSLNVAYSVELKDTSTIFNMNLYQPLYLYSFEVFLSCNSRLFVKVHNMFCLYF